MALINQDATIRALVQLHEETGVKTAQSIRVVREMPEADVVERKRGKWAHDGSKWANRFICSECLYKLFDEPTNFCPDCGSDNREENDNEVV